MAQALIALGSNAGDRRQTMAEAIERLGHQPQVRLMAQSSLRETVPAGGPPNQENFLNAAALVETSLPSLALLATLQQIEIDLGRRRMAHWGPRSIDLDLLLYDTVVCQAPDLVLPHPRMAWRRFVLEPAAEIAPEMLHPPTGWTLGRLLEHLNTTSWYVALAGPIGAGKSRLAAEVVRRTASLGIPVRAIREKIDLARLATFYASPPRHAWQLELEFLEQRTEELATAQPVWAEDRPAVSDYWFDQSLAFARVWLPEAQWPEYHARWQAARQRVVRPRLVVCLQATVDDLLRRIAARGRPGEINLTAEQLARIDESIRRQTQVADQGPVMRLAVGELETMVEEVAAAIVAMH